MNNTVVRFSHPDDISRYVLLFAKRSNVRRSGMARSFKTRKLLTRLLDAVNQYEYFTCDIQADDEKGIVGLSVAESNPERTKWISTAIDPIEKIHLSLNSVFFRYDSDRGGRRTSSESIRAH